MRKSTFAGAIALLVWCAPIQAAFIADGTYRLHNHPDGSANPPPYGMRLDELVDFTPGLDIITFSFDMPGTDMRLDYSSVTDTIHIYGVVFGGRDIGAIYDPAASEFCTVDFTYNIGVSPVPGDDDVWVQAASGSNTGSIVCGAVFGAHSLSDKFSMDFQHNFRFGDEDNDLGHRGFPGISGWGWLMYDGGYHETSDWLFTAELIPEPASLTLLGAGLLLLARRRGRTA